jgi:hypothetical protein
MKKILMVILLLGSSLPVIAASWIEIDYKQYMMIENIEGNNVYYWIKDLNDGTFKKIDNIIPAYNMIHYVSDCTKNKAKNLAFYAYSKNGNVISSFEDETLYTDWKTPIPQSNGELWHQSACYAVNQK